MTVLSLVLSLFLVTGDPSAPVNCNDDPTEPCILTAAPVTSGSITVDGQLDEPGWEGASVATGFQQRSPNEGARASQRTEVRVLYGDNNLYVGAVLYDSHPDRIRDRLGRRDDRNQADWFSVSIDSYFDRMTAYTFAVNAAGVQRDGIRDDNGGGRNRLDTSWDAIWESDVRITSEGWVVEMRIPYSMLRFTENAQQWGIQFQRRIPRNSEVAEWRLIPRTERESGVVSQYGILDGLNDLNPKRNLEVAPYTMSSLQTQEGDPGQIDASTTFDVGGDLRVGLGPNMTLDATINPDFGQVESDPAQLNLTAFETFFRERRPFFVEGTQIFDFDLGRRSNLIYTRRIGAEAPVIGASKLTGRTFGGLSYGVMAATTGERFSPTRSYGVASLQQEIGTQSSVEGALTAFEAPEAEGRRRSFTGGTEWDLRFLDNTYQFEGQASFAHRGGSDVLDTESGFSVASELGRVRGAWTYEVGFRLLDDEFNPNDIGQLRRNNYFRTHANLSHDFNSGKPFGPFQRADAFINVSQSWSYDDRIDQGLGYFFRSDWETNGFQSIELQSSADHLLGGYDLFETRGLWPRARPRTVDLAVEYSTDSRRSWQLSPEIETTWRSDGGVSYDLELQSDWNIGSRLSLSGSISYEIENNFVEWASNETFIQNGSGQWAIGVESGPPDRVDTYRSINEGSSQLSDLLASVAPYDDSGPSGSDPYYVPVYGARDTRHLDFTLRTNVTLTPTLSIEYFGQLFAARGQYDQFQLLPDPDNLHRLDTYPKRHDFSFSSFISNAVLRWEFQPGSELFLVWSQDRRRDLDDPFFFDAARSSPFNQTNVDQLGDTFTIFPQNTFLIKVRYTILH